MFNSNSNHVSILSGASNHALSNVEGSKCSMRSRRTRSQQQCSFTEPRPSTAGRIRMIRPFAQDALEACYAS
jgi:hypothetical protein